MYLVFAATEELSVVTPHRGLLPVSAFSLELWGVVLQALAHGKSRQGMWGSPKCVLPKENTFRSIVSCPSAFHSNESSVSELKSVPGMYPVAAVSKGCLFLS